MAESKHHKGTPLVLLGIVAITAIVGLVLMFVSTGPTGKGVYGGAIKGVEYPNWDGRSGATSPWGDDTYQGKRDPAHVESTRSSCGAGAFQVTQSQVAYYVNERGYTAVEHPTLGEMWCVTPGSAMI